MPAKDQGSLATQANKLQRADESQEFQESYGESFANTLDLNTWTPGEDLLAAYARLDQEVGEALAREDIGRVLDRPPGAGVDRGLDAAPLRLQVGDRVRIVVAAPRIGFQPGRFLRGSRRFYVDVPHRRFVLLGGGAS